MSSFQPFLQEVVDAHVAIEQWLSGQAAVEALAPLLARFSPDFSMVTLQGALLDHVGLIALFSRGHGARPGLHIALDELRGIQAGPHGAVVAYRETQVDGAGRRTVRRSTAVFERAADGRIAWRHLHETPVAE